MCEYCKNSKDMSRTGIFDEKSITIQDVDQLCISDVMFYTQTTINYCPMCGEKLNPK